MSDFYVPRYKHELVDYIRVHCHSLSRLMVLRKKSKGELYAIYYRLRTTEASNARDVGSPVRESRRENEGRGLECSVVR